MAGWSLSGPTPLDLGAVHASATSALDEAARLVADGGGPTLRPLAGAPLRPGLYLIWREEGARALAGFWLVFGPSYLDSGPPGPPEREPPFARELLTAVTEAVWWQHLPVWPRQGDTWRPVMVLEWPPELASRAEVAPPGVPPARPTRAPQDARDSGWLDEPAPVVVEEVHPQADAGAPWAHLPAARSLVAIVRAELAHRGGRHSGRYELQTAYAAGPGPVAFDAWLGEESGAVDGEAAPLELPGGRVGFPLRGWLTRALALWPPRAADARAAALQERDVGGRWRKAVVRVVASTLGVLAVVLYLAGFVKLASEPEIRTSPGAPVADPQPAMSVCSADHEHYVAELRCQLRALAEGADPREPVCGDPGAPASERDAREDLQAAWCGLRDRDLDGWSARKGVAFADLAASKACFNVLGHPYSYTSVPAGSTTPVVDPDRFLRDRDLALRGLVALVGELDESCELHRGRVQNQVEGAILATLVGAPTSDAVESEASALRAALVQAATAARALDEAQCYRAGAEVGVGAPRAYAELCTTDEARPLTAPAGKGWAALRGDERNPRTSVVARYTEARFGASRRPTSTAPWQCHQELTSGRRRETGAAPTRWDLSAPLPARYEVRQGLVRTQLVLDAALRAIAEGADAGPCWQVAARDLARYTPVHPLLGPETANKWPSAEQQLCGQICAARYRVRNPARRDEWLTPGGDLSMCLDSTPPDSPPDFGLGHLDRLSLPWNEPERGQWTTPTEDEICAFHLVSQSYFPVEEGGVLADGLAPQLWAGSTATGSALAGGLGGAAVEAAKSLSSYGRARSESTCGYVATQCFVAGGLRVLSDTRAEPYQWMGRWRGWLAGLSTADTPRSPWCELVAPYVHADGVLPEGQMDYPCASGVDATRRGVDLALQQLASGSVASVRP